ncbi:MAG: MSCRAMM family protein [Candidatus Methylomirabilia bacterium]
MKRGAGAGLVAAAVLFALVLPSAVPREALSQSPDAAAAKLSGKVTRETRGVGGARVLAYRSFSDLLARRAVAVSEPCAADGGYLLSLPAGTYYLVARAQEGPLDGPVPAGGLFAFHGSNPYTLSPDTVTEANFSLARKASEAVVKPAADPGSGTLGGVVTWGGAGLAGVQVKLYLDAESAFRGMGYAAAPPTDECGAFSFDFLPESSYYVVARKRAAGGGPGPLAEGDLYGYYADNPVPVHAGTAVEIALELVSKGREIGNADGRPRPSGTRITGRITDAAGTVVRGVYAFAYEEKVMAHKKPAFISREVDDQGRYVIHLSRAGTFYVGARSAYGDSPGKGEWYGRYDGTTDHGVTVGEGASAEGVDIRVERILQ